MTVDRRSLLALAAAFPVLAHAEDADPRMADRALGEASAPVTVWEWFSLTCTHCAAFQRETFPRVKAELIDTGKIRYVWKDFPLDQVALTAAMVARALPPERYEPFISALLSTQDRWAYARGVDTTAELAKLSALAGLSRATFNTTIGDTGLRNAILGQQEVADKEFKVNSTPSFILNPAGAKKLVPGAIGFDDFARAVASV